MPMNQPHLFNIYFKVFIQVISIQWLLSESITLYIKINADLGWILKKNFTVPKQGFPC